MINEIRELSSLDFRLHYSKLIREGQALEPNVEKEVKRIPSCEKRLWRNYRRTVWIITEKQNLKKLPDFQKRAFRGYHLDHKVSIWYGYKNKIDPKLIGSIDNLEFIPHKENMQKGKNCNFKGAKPMQTIIFTD